MSPLTHHVLMFHIPLQCVMLIYRKLCGTKMVNGNIKDIFKTCIKLHLKKDRNWGDSTMDKGTIHSGLVTQL